MNFAAHTVLGLYLRCIDLGISAETHSTNKRTEVMQIYLLRQRFFSLAFFLFKADSIEHGVKEPCVTFLNEPDIVQLLLNKDRRIGLLLYNMLFKCLSRFTDDKHLNGNVFEHLVNKLASSTVAREKSDIDRFLPHIGHYKLTELRPEHFRKLYVALHKEKNMINGKPLSELTVEGVHACLCGILSDAVESGLLDHNPAWRTYKYSNIDKKQQVVADEEIMQKLICALEKESIKYETYFKLIIATGIRRGECCGIKWSDIDYAGRSIHIYRNVVKVSGEDICIKEPKTKAGNRYVYFSPEMGTLLKEYRRYCETEALHYEGRIITDNDFLFRKHDLDEPMTPTTFTWRFKLILKKNDLPYNLNVHSLRHTNASLLIANGTDVATVSSLLGHAQVSTTLDIYTHAFDKNKKAASDKLHNALEI